MMLSNLSVPLVGMVDTAVMGHLDHAYYIGAVAIGSLIFSFVYWGLGFLRMSTTGLAAQALGANQQHEATAVLSRGILIALVLAAALLLLQPLIAGLAFSLLDASAEVETHARHYFDIRICSAPATLVTYVVIGWFLAQKNARVPLLITLVVNSINILLDIILVVGLGMTIAGVAWASVVADYSGLAVGIYITLAMLRRQQYRIDWIHIIQRTALAKWFSVNHTIFIRTLCLIFTFAFFTAQSAEFGDVILAANAILLNFQTLMAYLLDAFAHAAEALVGHDIGARDESALRHTVSGVITWSGIFAVLFSLLYGLAGTLIIAALSDIEAVRQGAHDYLPWLIASPLISVWSFAYDGIFIGATRTRAMRDSMIFSTFAVFLPSWYFSQAWGNHGLWLAMMLFLASRGLTLAYLWRRYRRYRTLFADPA